MTQINACGRALLCYINSIDTPNRKHQMNKLNKVQEAYNLAIATGRFADQYDRNVLWNSLMEKDQAQIQAIIDRVKAA